MISKIVNGDSILEPVFLMDNVKFHKIEDVVVLMENNGCFLYTPPYSPFLNPIENIFSKMKNWIKSKEPKNQEDLFSLVDMASKEITPEDCRNYILHSEKYLIDCLEKKRDFKLK